MPLKEKQREQLYKFGEYVRVDIITYRIGDVSLAKAYGLLTMANTNGTILSSTNFEISGGWSGDDHEEYDVWVGNNNEVEIILSRLSVETVRHGTFYMQSVSKVHRRR